MFLRPELQGSQGKLSHYSLMRHLAGDHVLFAIDDIPTARYGPKVQSHNREGRPPRNFVRVPNCRRGVLPNINVLLTMPFTDCLWKLTAPR